MSAVLSAGLAALGLPDGGRARERLDLLLGELDLWNIAGFVNAEGDDVVVRHVLDCAAAVDLLAGMEPETAADLGSGAGFPGLVLAVFMSRTAFTLVERSAKRAAFLENAAAVMALDNVAVRSCPIERLEARFDLVTWRAFRPLAAVEDAVARLVGDGGRIAAYKGRRDKIREELAECRRGWKRVEIVPISVPFLDEERHILILEP